VPIYDYKCDKCERTQERIKNPDEVSFRCPDNLCTGTMHRQFHSRFGINMGVGAYGYYDDNLGTYIRTNAHKRQVMRDQGVSEKFGKGWQ
jgi:putative FmdB family regulatory protein